MMEKTYQQGDVYFQTTKIPTKKLEKILDSIIQWGESTGHKHQLFRHDSRVGIPTKEAWELFQDPETKERFLKVLAPVDLKHEEHHTINIPPGEYRVGIVREYDHLMEEARQVVD